MRYRKLLKAILVVEATTCSEISYLELGRLSIKTEKIFNNINFGKECKSEMMEDHYKELLRLQESKI